MLRRWKCTDPNCKMNREGLIRMTDQPAYAQVTCEMCGAPMTPIAGDDQIIFVGDYPSTTTVLYKTALLADNGSNPKALEG